MKKPRVFLGSSSERAESLHALWRLVNIDDWALPRYWNDIASPGTTILKSLLENKDEVDFAILLFAPDDRTVVRGTEHWTVRDNLVFELGLFMGKLGPERAVIVAPTAVAPKIPSDLQGYTIIKYDPTQGDPSEYFWSAADRLRRTFMAAWRILQQRPDNPPAPEVKRVSIEMQTFSAGPIPVYRDPDAPMDWYQEFANAVRNVIPSLSSKLLYFAPGGARLWRLMTRSAEAYEELQKTFLASYRQVFEDFGAPNLNIIDLGVGDFEKGKVILNYYLGNDSTKTLNYFPLDICYDMLSMALDPRSEPVLKGVLNRGSVVGIHAPFADLRLYNHLFARPNSNVFLLLGNTLGNELSEVQTLQDIHAGMNEGDHLVTELQLIEDEPKSAKDLTSSLQKTKYFYAGPFAAIGCDVSEIDLFVKQEDSAEAVTYNIYCQLRNPKDINHPLVKGTLRFKNTAFLVYVVRKYRAEGISGFFEKAGFEVRREYSTRPQIATGRRFHYVTARKL